jgi:hypothetical protein
MCHFNLWDGSVCVFTVAEIDLVHAPANNRKKNERGTRDRKIDGGQFVEFEARVLNKSFRNLMDFCCCESCSFNFPAEIGFIEA